ncbi:MAG: hypothetical protein WA667_23980 [Candidatus Nitrosopolaris sp.]
MLNDKRTMVIALGLVAVFMMSAPTFSLRAYADPLRRDFLQHPLGDTKNDRLDEAASYVLTHGLDFAGLLKEKHH